MTPTWKQRLIDFLMKIKGLFKKKDQFTMFNPLRDYEDIKGLDNDLDYYLNDLRNDINRSVGVDPALLNSDESVQSLTLQGVCYTILPKEKKKMNRREFTEANAKLTLRMIAEGEQPVDDYLMRSDEEQNRLFKLGLSGCDGYTRKSDHQKAAAIDKYLTRVNANGSVTVLFDWDPVKAEYWHKVWEEMGGQPMTIFHVKKRDIKGNVVLDDKGEPVMVEVKDYPHFA